MLIGKFIDTVKTCRKKSKAECRFNFPQPPMKSTKILYPLGSDISEGEIRKCKDMWKTISKHLNDMKEGEDISFDQLLINLNITENSDHPAVRSSLNSPAKFLKRSPNELRVYNLSLMFMLVQCILYPIFQKHRRE